MNVVDSARIGPELQEARESLDPVPWAVLSQEYGIPVWILLQEWRRHKKRCAVFAGTTVPKIYRETVHLYIELVWRTLELAQRTENPTTRTAAFQMVEETLVSAARTFALLAGGGTRR